MDTPTYEQKKIFADELKDLTQDQYEEIFRIIKRAGIPYSENNNGIFFDLCSVDSETYNKLIHYMDFVRSQKEYEKQREIDIENCKIPKPE
jgi:hypothetical protein